MFPALFQRLIADARAKRKVSGPEATPYAVFVKGTHFRMVISRHASMQDARAEARRVTLAYCATGWSVTLATPASTTLRLEIPGADPAALTVGFDYSPA